MRAPYSSEVILVGFEASPQARRLAAKLSSMEMPVSRVTSPHQAPTLLRNTQKATIVVYNPEHGTTAEVVLEQVERSGRAIPVVVLVDDSDFAEYYSLMNRGAMEYFTVKEDASVIVRGVEWAARRCSA